jgi:hypothetical protein
LLDREMVRIVNSSNPDMSPWPEQTLLLYELTGERERESEGESKSEAGGRIKKGRGDIERGEGVKRK